MENILQTYTFHLQGEVHRQNSNFSLQTAKWRRLRNVEQKHTGEYECEQKDEQERARTPKSSSFP